MLSSGVNRLLVAASEGDCEMILWLIKDEKIPISHEFQHGVTALHEACEGGHIDATQLLVDLGADVNKQVFYCGDIYQSNLQMLKGNILFFSTLVEKLG